MEFLLFSGHMIDNVGTKTTRFPPSKEKPVRKVIADLLIQIKNHYPGIKAIAGGACGGDILFHEACLNNRIPSEMIIPIPPDQFLEHSVAFAGSEWIQRFKKLLTTISYQVLYNEPSPDVPIWESTNLKMISLASSGGNKNTMLLALWDMHGENKPGSTYSMIQLAQKNGIAIQLINLKNV